jgi:hypothetical protein
MTRHAQKQEELQLVEQMRRLRGGDPAGIVAAVGEPDVCIVTGDRRIGVEVTELHQRPRSGRPPGRIQESERARIVARTQALAEAAGIPALDVAVHFTDLVPVGKGDRDILIRGLVKLVSENIPDVDHVTEIEVWRHPHDLLPGVRLVRVFRAEVLTKHHWSAPDSGWVQSEFVEELQQAIDAKNSLHAIYSRRCDECWLLVTASGSRPSGFLIPSDKTREHVYRSAFTKTFFMEVFGQMLIELRTTAA